MLPSKEIYTYRAPWPVYGLAWCHNTDNPFRLAFGSFVEEYINKVQVVELSTETQDLKLVAEADHEYPLTKILWSPEKSNQNSNMFATTGDYLRIWDFKDSSRIENKCRLNNIKSNAAAPQTSFDWNETSPNLIVTASIDTTCTVWDLNTQAAKTQLIAHDKEVYDVAFASGTSDIFASVGADGSVRMFDLRALEHSTIIYESPAEGQSSPLLRLDWNKLDPNYIATFQVDSNQVIILDIRIPTMPVTELRGHQAAVNSCVWAPHSSGHICTAGDDSQALVWDLSQMSRGKYVQEPILAYQAESEINQLSWSSTKSDWVAISFGQSVQALRV
ncbi:DDB1 and CUL4-associated factor 7 [Paraphysoderma sedebokerense]|nr:DDB1 and CUL4-associated factor 7 [Paraphysoderma sedebokerense]